jgi:hypothetical protein
MVQLRLQPELFKPLSLQTLQEFYLGLADELLREASPLT